MTERTKTFVAVGLGVVLLAVIGFGLADRPSDPLSSADRIEALSAVIKCPFCAGESLADSSSSVAADYRTLIAEYVEAGWTDEMIRAEFVRNFGESVILDGSTSSWSVLLWALPVIALVAGAGVIVAMRRSSMSSEEASRAG